MNLLESEAHDEIPKPPQHRNQYLAAFSVYLGLTSMGNAIAWTSPVLLQLASSNNHTNSSAQPFHLTETQVAIVGSMLPLGGLIAALPMGYAADKIGTRKTILVMQSSFLISWLLLALADRAEVFYLARFIGGLGCGAMSFICSTYVSEIAAPQIRGTLGALAPVFHWCGVILTYAMGAAFHWRVLTAILILIPIVTTVLVWRLPEAPAFLFQKGRVEEAKRVLVYYNGPHVNKEMAAMEKAEAERNAKKLSTKSFLTVKSYRRALIVVLLVGSLQQTCGMSVIIFYTGPLFQAAGSSLDPYIATIIVALVKLTFSSLAAQIIDKAGRRFFMFTSLLGMCACCIAMGLFFHLKEFMEFPKVLGLLPVFSLCLFCVFFCVGVSPILFVLPGELFPPSVRGSGTGIVSVTVWFCVFFITFTFPLVNVLFGRYVPFYMFAFNSAVGCVLVYFMMPETRHKSLEEMQEILKKGFR